jgi:hypothetical protein
LSDSLLFLWSLFSPSIWFVSRHLEKQHVIQEDLEAKEEYEEEEKETFCRITSSLDPLLNIFFVFSPISFRKKLYPFDRFLRHSCLEGNMFWRCWLLRKAVICEEHWEEKERKAETSFFPSEESRYPSTTVLFESLNLYRDINFKKLSLNRYSVS